MDYGKVLSRAWQITWRWKILWILGFLAALGNGSGGGSGSSSYSGDGREWEHTFQHGVPGEVWAIIAAVACLAVIIGIAIWVVSVIARGGLIAGVQQVEDEGSTSFGSAWRAGAKRFWTLFGISILASIPFIILFLAGIVVLVAMFAGSGVALGNQNDAVGGLGLAASILCGGVFCCGMVILGIILQQIRVYAERAAILEGLGWIDAFKRGWQVIKENLGPTVVFWLIFLVIGLLIAIVVGGILFAAAIPLIAIFSNTDPGAWLLAPVCCGGLLALIVGGLIGAIVETFTSATWTLAYREMTGLAKPAAPVAEPVAMEE
jgi:hypothetical protein